MADLAPQETYAITLPVRDYTPQHFLLDVAGKTATITLNRPDRKNPLTFQSYAELRGQMKEELAVAKAELRQMEVSEAEVEACVWTSGRLNVIAIKTYG